MRRVRCGVSAPSSPVGVARLFSHLRCDWGLCGLAEDSALERLNSVLEPARTLVLAEKVCSTDADAGSSLAFTCVAARVPQGGNPLEEITAVPEFCLLATMNPGGDFGKKELSPALRNRFTEIWAPQVTDPADLVCA